MDRFSQHFQQRAVQRRMTPEMLAFVLEYGRSVSALGAVHYTVLDRDLPAALRGQEPGRRVRDWIVVLSPDGVLITCYRRPGAARFLQRKSDRSELPRAA